MPTRKSALFLLAVMLCTLAWASDADDADIVKDLAFFESMDMIENLDVISVNGGVSLSDGDDQIQGAHP